MSKEDQGALLEIVRDFIAGTLWIFTCVACVKGNYQLAQVLALLLISVRIGQRGAKS